MNCCPNCFNDEFMIRLLSTGAHRGDCFYCGSPDVHLTEVGDLADYFLKVVDIYEESDAPEARHIADLLQEHWNIFAETEHRTLLTDILKAHGFTEDQRYRARREPDESLIVQWEEFAQEIKHHNRYFIESAPTHAIEKLLQGLLSELSAGTHVYRARAKQSDTEFKDQDLMSPPPQRASAGRANPHGISYLYTASDAQTAIAEVRPQRGQCVTVATIEVTRSMAMIDLRDPFSKFSPFQEDIAQDGEELDLEEARSSLIPLLGHLGEELEKPVLTEQSSLEYLPSQYLCEFIKSLGAYNGILYQSSQGNGDNIVAFSSEGFEYLGSEDYVVQAVEFDSRPI